MRLQVETRIGSSPKQKTLSFNSEEVLLGRHVEWLGQEDEFLSKAHAKIVVENDGALRLVDLGSRNGTFVNGKRITEIALVAGDEIRIGRTILRVLESQKALINQWPALFSCHSVNVQRKFRGQF